MNKFKTRLLREDYKNAKLLWLAFLTGTLVGLVSSAFRFLLENVDRFRTQFLISNDLGWEKYLVYAVIVTLCVCISLILVKRFAPETAGSGIQEIEGTLDDHRNLNWKRVIPIKFIASLFSLGSGMLLGREGPTIQLGASLGKMVKVISKHPDEENNPLVSTGAAAGLAGAFNAPLSGLIFVIEEMNGHFKFNFYSLASIMVGVGMSDLMVRMLIGSMVSLPLEINTSGILQQIWLFPILGILFGGFGWVYNHGIIFALDFFKKYQNHFIWIALFFGGILSIAAFFSMDWIGAGYETIHNVVKGSFTIQFLVVLLIVRVVLSLLSYGSGVPGGLFAPMLALGIILGMIYGIVMQTILPFSIPDAGVFAIAGMAAVFASTVRAPLTGVALAVEMTYHFELILPLILTTVAASIITTMLGNRPIYTILLERIINDSSTPK